MIKVGIVGATGYTGAELIRILLTHPEVKITSLTAKIEESQPVQEIFPQFRGFIDMECKKFETIGEITKNVELVFLALPHTVSLEVVPEFLDSGIKVIDLSADYRFDSGEIYEEWYGVKHPYPALLREKVYGLAELYRDKIKKSHFVANPGCYPTSVILGLYPIVKMGLVEEVIVDSLSGISGAGRKADLSFIFPEVEGNLKAYKIATHRHQPE
ncbi:MAG TPA: N-acetyl-gamma-glutamyl-phosphate reductase, partial [Candidatus Omnitrophica bacterium]|nr:N-acetyl-gamma-glutamyl-phosphate reductase [Candidatus Omnitrophota bacterium]